MRLARASCVLVALTACGDPSSKTSPSASAAPPVASSSFASVAPSASAEPPVDVQSELGRIEDPKTRRDAIDALARAFDVAMKKDHDDRNGPTVAPFLELVVKPLTKVCVDAVRGDVSGTKLIHILSEVRDTRVAPCWNTLLRALSPEQERDDLQAVLRAVARSKPREVAPAVWDLFEKVNPSEVAERSRTFLRDLQAALVAVVAREDEDKLLAIVARAIPEDDRGAADEDFRQSTAAIALGEIKSAKAVRPLLGVLVVRAKARRAVRQSALGALVKIGKPTLAPALALLRGDDKELVKLASTEREAGLEGISDPNELAIAKALAKDSHVAIAAEVLGALGREDAAAPMIAAIDKATAPTKVLVALELPNLPESAATVRAFESVYTGTKTDLKVGPARAKERLVAASVAFYDAELVPWMLEQAASLKGEPADVEAIRGATLASATSLMRPDQVDAVKKLFDTPGADGETPIGRSFATQFTAAKGVLDACKEDLACYLKKVAEPGADEKSAAGPLKAAYMLGVLGTPDSKQKLLDTLPSISNPAVKRALLGAIAYASAHGDETIAAKLQTAIDEADASQSDEALQRVAPLRGLVALLQARAG